MRKKPRAISIFNEKDKDIVIKERAIFFEKLGKSRTYIILGRR